MLRFTRGTAVASLTFLHACSYFHMIENHDANPYTHYCLIVINVLVSTLPIQ
jgi:hypothetical protein